MGHDTLCWLNETAESRLGIRAGLSAAPCVAPALRNDPDTGPIIADEVVENIHIGSGMSGTRSRGSAPSQAAP